MHRSLLRSTFTSILIATIIFGLPTLVLGWQIASAAEGSSPGGAPVPAMVFVGIMLALAAVTIGVVAIIASRQAHKLSEPLKLLAEQAERLGAGDARYERIRSGITEIDRVSEVLSNSAHQLLSSLSSERDFASDASHQLRTPLTALLMRLEEISMTDNLAEAQEEATIAIGQVERLNDTVDTLLGRARKNTQSHKPMDVSLDSVIAALLKDWQPAFENAHRSIHVTGERGLRIATTEVALAQIMSTLVENSLVHGAGTVRVDARRSGPSCIVEVSDQGPGVDPEIATRIFERSVSTKSTGLGLGLARDLAEAHGGRLELVRGYPVVFALFLSAVEGS